MTSYWFLRRDTNYSKEYSRITDSLYDNINNWSKTGSSGYKNMFMLSSHDYERGHGWGIMISE